MRRLLLATTALVALAGAPAAADPISIAVGAVVGAAAGIGTTGSLIAGTLAFTFSASTALAGAVIGAAGAALKGALAKKPRAPGRTTAGGLLVGGKATDETARILYGRRRIAGQIVAEETFSGGAGAPNRYYNAVIAIAPHECDGCESVEIGRTTVWTEAQYQADEAAATKPVDEWGLVDSPYRSRIIVRVYRGAADQPAEPVFARNSANWTADSRLRGTAYIYVLFDFDQSLFGGGVDPVTSVWRGKRVFDPRDGSTAWTANPALHLRDYFLTPEQFGGVGALETEVDDDSVVALANVCDEVVGGEARYAFNGVLDTGDDPRTNFDRLSTAWGGWWTWRSGKLAVGGGSWTSPTADIDEDWLTAGYVISPRRPFDQQFNEVRAQFAPPEDFYVPTDLPAVDSAAARAEDGGQLLTRDLGDLPGEVSSARGQRLLKLALLKARRQIGVTLTGNLRAWGVRAGDTVTLTIPRRGWAAKTFEVVRRTAQIGSEGFGIQLELIESAAAVFDWQTSEEVARPAGPATSLPSRFDLPEATAPVVTEELYETRGGGGVKVRLRLSASLSNPFVRSYQFRWRRGDQTADEAVTLPVSENPFALIDDAAPGVYIFGLRVTTTTDRTSAWVDGPPVAVAGLNAAPVALSGLSLQAQTDIVLARWTPHPSLDVRQGGRIEVRWTAATSGATWQGSTSLGEAIPGGATNVTLPLRAGTYLFRPFDALGIAGPVVSRVNTISGLGGLTLAATVTEDPGFAGTATDCTAAGGLLSLDAGQTAATYDFAGGLDLGAVEDVRLSALATVAIGERDDLIFAPAGDPMFGPAEASMFADDAGRGDVVIEARATDDDPAGSPVWGDWQRLDVGRFRARAFQFRALLTAESDGYSVSVSALSIEAYQ